MTDEGSSLGVDDVLAVRPLPCPSSFAPASATSKAFAAGFIRSAYSFASIPFGNSTRQQVTPASMSVAATFSAPRSPASSRSKAISDLLDAVALEGLERSRA